MKKTIGHYWITRKLEQDSRFVQVFSIVDFSKVDNYSMVHERISLFLEIYTEEFRVKRHDMNNFFSKKFRGKNMYIE